MHDESDCPPFRPTPEPFLWPQFLFGRAEEVRKEWAAVQRSAEKSGEWESVIADCEMVSVHHDTAPIIMEIRRLPPTEPLWHPYWIGETLVDRANPKRIPVINHLTLLGLDYCWFALGILASDRHAAPKLERDRRFFYEMFRRYVYWIPELRVIGQRYSTCGSPPFDPFFWQSQMLRLASDAFDLSDDARWYRLLRSFSILSHPDMLEPFDVELMNEPGFEPIDGIEALIRGGILEEAAGRFRVVREPPTDGE